MSLKKLFMYCLVCSIVPVGSLMANWKVAKDLPAEIQAEVNIESLEKEKNILEKKGFNNRTRVIYVLAYLTVLGQKSGEDITIEDIQKKLKIFQLTNEEFKMLYFDLRRPIDVHAHDFPKKIVDAILDLVIENKDFDDWDKLKNLIGLHEYSDHSLVGYDFNRKGILENKIIDLFRKSYNENKHFMISKIILSILTPEKEKTNKKLVHLLEAKLVLYSEWDHYILEMISLERPNIQKKDIVLLLSHMNFNDKEIVTNLISDSAMANFSEDLQLEIYFILLKKKIQFDRTQMMETFLRVLSNRENLCFTQLLNFLANDKTVQDDRIINVLFDRLNEMGEDHSYLIDKNNPSHRDFWVSMASSTVDLVIMAIVKRTRAKVLAHAIVVVRYGRRLGNEVPLRFYAQILVQIRLNDLEKFGKREPGMVILQHDQKYMDNFKEFFAEGQLIENTLTLYLMNHERTTEERLNVEMGLWAISLNTVWTSTVDKLYAFTDPNRYLEASNNYNQWCNDSHKKNGIEYYNFFNQDNYLHFLISNWPLNEKNGAWKIYLFLSSIKDFRLNSLSQSSFCNGYNSLLKVREFIKGHNWSRHPFEWEYFSLLFFQSAWFGVDSYEKITPNYVVEKLGTILSLM